MFEKASRLKLRFNYKGLCSVEDLWEISLNALDSIFKELNAKSKAQKEESLFELETVENEILDLQIAIVRHIASVRLKEAAETRETAEKAKRKQKLLEIISRKKDAALEELPIEELTKLAEGM